MPRRAATPPVGQEPLPVQPVERPILCRPYDEPTEHWVYQPDSGDATRAPGRRPASYWFKSARQTTAQLPLLGEEQREELPLVNRLRKDVKRWRSLNYENATAVTRELLRFWAREDRPRRLFFCQLEAVETVIYLNEILGSGRKPRWTAELSPDDYERLRRRERPAFVPHEQEAFPTGDHKRVVVKVIDPRGNEVVRVHALTPEAVYA